MVDETLTLRKRQEIQKLAQAQAEEQERLEQLREQSEAERKKEAYLNERRELIGYVTKRIRAELDQEFDVSDDGLKPSVQGLYSTIGTDYVYRGYSLTTMGSGDKKVEGSAQFLRGGIILHARNCNYDIEVTVYFFKEYLPHIPTIDLASSSTKETIAPALIIADPKSATWYGWSAKGDAECVTFRAHPRANYYTSRFDSALFRIDRKAQSPTTLVVQCDRLLNHLAVYLGLFEEYVKADAIKEKAEEERRAESSAFAEKYRQQQQREKSITVAIVCLAIAAFFTYCFAFPH